MTIHSTQVFDRNMEQQPSLRVITTDIQEATRVIALPQVLEMDIEHIVATGFYSKKIQNVLQSEI